MASADILRAARARIEDPKNWMRNWYALLPSGRPTRGNDPDACCWCSLGALQASGSCDTSPEAALLDECAIEMFGEDIIDVNDGLGHGAVMEVFRVAIETAEAGR